MSNVLIVKQISLNRGASPVDFYRGYVPSGRRRSPVIKTRREKISHREATTSWPELKKKFRG